MRSPIRIGAGTSRQTHDPVPAVDLLSPWVHQELAVRRTRGRMMAATAALVVLLAAVWSVQHLRVTHAREVLSEAQAETQRLEAEAAELAPLSVYIATVEQRKVLVAETMSGDVALSQVVRDVRALAPAGAHLDSVVVGVTPPVREGVPATGANASATSAQLADATCPGPDPFNTRTVVGCITLTGTAASRADVGELVVALGHDQLFVEPFISTTTTGEGTEVTFTGSVGLSQRVFTQRYAEMDDLLAQQESAP